MKAARAARTACTVQTNAPATAGTTVQEKLFQNSRRQNPLHKNTVKRQLEPRACAQRQLGAARRYALSVLQGGWEVFERNSRYAEELLEPNWRQQFPQQSSL